MQQSISPSIGKDTLKGETEAKSAYRNIRARSTGAPHIRTDNSFLKTEFPDIYPSKLIPNLDYARIANPQKNIEKLVKTASNYLAQYGRKLSFTPNGNFEQDLSRLVKVFTRQLPPNQLLNVDFSTNEFVFIVYQSHAEHYWGTITYIPVSIAYTMRPTIRKLFIRFITFMMQQNGLPLIKNTCDYEFIIEDIQNRMSLNGKGFEEVGEEYIQIMRSYKNKKGKAYKLLQQITQCPFSQPSQLLTDLKNLKRLSATEAEQVACMIRGIELMSQGMLEDFEYNITYDEYNESSEQDNNEYFNWKDMICISFGIGDSDPLVQYHFEMLNEECQNSYITEPTSFTILTEDKIEKLPSCNFPFEWLKYICDDYFKYLVLDN